MHELMDQYGDSDISFGEKNQLGENILVSIFNDRISVRTFQINGWVRVNTYWRDGTTEETFDGRARLERCWLL